MSELLIEVGCEELPATFVRKAVSDLGTRIGSALVEAGLIAEGTEPSIALGTPRRLIISFADIKDRQEDQTKEMRGPGLKGAYDASGNPTPALLGFCRGQGVDVANVRNDGQYVWVDKHVVGAPAAELLQEILPKAIRGLSFEKSMRWGSSRMRFARPIRWLLALLDGAVVPFEIEGVVSGNQSCGHRFYAPARFEVSNAAGLIASLRERKVEPDPEIRRAMITDGAMKVAGGSPELPAALIEENVYLTEFPTAIAGEFKPEYLELPEPVLVTAMAKHERMFPVRGADGKLVNRFVFARNSGEDETVTAGCAWVLNARFNDAKFFYDEDQKSTLEDFLAKTEGIVFQEKLGTVRQRTDRLVALVKEVALATGADAAEVGFAEQAARFAKADLASGLVSELSSLQGVVGGEYARREGMPEPVAAAIGAQYDPNRYPSPTTPEGRTAVRLLIADQLDKLAGYLGIGLEPSGSSDPYALRRSASVLIEAAWNWPAALPAYDQLFDAALAQYAAQGVILDDRGAHVALYDVFGSRYPAMLSVVRYDILDAALLREYGWGLTQPQGVLFRTRLMANLASDEGFVQTATRPLNLVSSAKKKGLDYAYEDPLGKVDTTQLQSAEGVALLDLLKTSEDALFKAAREQDLATAERLLRALQPPINAFFEGTMMIVDEADVRFARLSLLHAASLQLLVAGDFGKLV